MGMFGTYTALFRQKKLGLRVPIYSTHAPSATFPSTAVKDTVGWDAISRKSLGIVLIVCVAPLSSTASSENASENKNAPFLGVHPFLHKNALFEGVQPGSKKHSSESSSDDFKKNFSVPS